eukprot:jgi/Botrbrau1/10102/Bobra.20_2s0009.1
MGNVAGTPSATSEDIELETGVRVTQDLLEQISGRKRSRVASAVVHSTHEVHGGRPLPPAHARLIQPPKYAEQLQDLKRSGDLLLKQGKEEVAAIEERAQQLLHSEYKAPSRDAACKEEASACLSCYNATRTGGMEMQTCCGCVFCLRKNCFLFICEVA